MKNVDVKDALVSVGGVDANSVEKAVGHLRNLVASIEETLQSREPIEPVDGPATKHIRRAPLLRRRFD